MAARPPGPNNGLLGLNNLKQLQRDYFSFARSLARDYGDTVYYRTGPVNVYQFTHPDQVHEVLVAKNRSFHKPARLKQVLGRWNGNGLVMNEGKSWARQRRLVQTAFHPHRVQSYAELIVRHTDRMMDAWGERDEVDMAREFARLTFGTVAEALFGAEVEPLAGEFIAHVDVLQEEAIRDFTSAVILPLWWPSARRQRLREAMRFLDDVVMDFIAKRRASGEDRGDLLSSLLLAVDEGNQGMSDRQARDEAVGLLLGGNETTATAVTWTCYLLARHTEIQAGIVDEIREGLGERAPTGDDAESLPQLERAFKEAIRLYPPAYATSREAVEAVPIGDYNLSRGDNVHLIIYATHRDPRWFDEPNAFQPSRFEHEDDFRPGSYFPFGAGPRACIGKGFATMEAVLILARLLSRYEVRWTRPDEPELEAEVSLHPKNGLPIQLKRRDSPVTAD